MWAIHVASLQISILQLLLCFCFSSLHVSQFRACDFFILCLCSYTSKKEHAPLLCCLTQKTKGSHWLCELCAQQHCNASLMYLTFSNIFVDMASSDHRVYSNMIQPQTQLHMLLHVTILWDQIGYFADIIIADSSYCWADALYIETGPRRQNPLYGNPHVIIDHIDAHHVATTLARSNFIRK